jgi:ribonuclease HI
MPSDTGDCGWAVVFASSSAQRKFSPGLIVMKRMPNSSGTYSNSNNSAEVEAVVCSVGLKLLVPNCHIFTDSQVAKSISDHQEFRSDRVAKRECFAAQRERISDHRNLLEKSSQEEKFVMARAGLGTRHQTTGFILDANHRHSTLLGYEGKNSIISGIKTNPVSWAPAHQKEKKLKPDPDEIVRDGNDEADQLAKASLRLPKVPDTLMPVSNQRFVATVGGRMLTGDWDKFLRRLGQFHAIGRMIKEVDLRGMVAKATDLAGNNEHISEKVDCGHESRRSSRIRDLSEVNYAEGSNMQLDGGDEVFLDVELEDRRESKHTTQGVVARALTRNPAFRFNPNTTMQELMIAGHRMQSPTRMMRGDAKLRDAVIRSGALITPNKLNQREPCRVEPADLCPLCINDKDGCSYGNQEHVIQFCPVFEESRCEMFEKVEMILSKNGNKILGGRWRVTYPGKLILKVDPRYVTRFPRLAEMCWLLPVLDSSSRKLASNIDETWILSHKTVIDNRIFTQLLSSWLRSRNECEEVMKEIQSVVIQGVVSIAKKAQIELSKVYGEIRSKMKISMKDESVQAPNSTESSEQPKSDVSEKKRKRISHTFECEGTWCSELLSKVSIKQNRNQTRDDLCKRCDKLRKVETLIIEFSEHALRNPETFAMILPGFMENMISETTSLMSEGTD